MFVASASSVTLSLGRRNSAAPDRSMLAIFVPPSLLATVDYKTAGKPTACANVWTLEDQKDLSMKVLSSVHPFLTEHARLVGIVLACHDKGKTAPADMILLSVSSKAPDHWLHDIKASLNGEHMAAATDAVLKLIPISSFDIVTDADARTPTRLASIPTCPVCLHRIDPLRLGMPKPQNHQLCSKFCPSATNPCRNQLFLRPWPPPSNCIACHVIHDRWKHIVRTEKDDLFCHQCAMQETLWVCLTCGFVGCGRYSHKHAAQHFDETGHPYSLELATLRIWFYTSGEFAHRGDLLECPSVQRGSSALTSGEKPIERAPSAASGYYDARIVNHRAFNSNAGCEEGASPKKANMIGEEYEALLQSALEDQAQHYEGEITRLRAELTAENVDTGTMTKDEANAVESLKSDIAKLRGEIDHLGRQFLDAQAQEAGYRADSQRLLREQSVAKDLLDKIQEEAARENMEGQMQMEELEQQVADLTANLKMRQQFSQDQELSNAQIFGTTSSSKKSTKRGKKLRRIFRK